MPLLARFSLCTGLLVAISLSACRTISASGVRQAETSEPIPNTIKILPDQKFGPWRGWGASLSWWANAVGDTKYADLYADLFFTEKFITINDVPRPGLGFTLARYNVGGGGRPGDREAVGRIKEVMSPELPHYRDVDGFWLDGKSQDPQSASWDWSRDAAQRQMLKASLARGVKTVEFFVNSPMWWMKDSHSSAGGKLLDAQIDNYVIYVAKVIKKAIKDWQVPVYSVDPFNEPSGSWWTFPNNQECAIIPVEQQARVLIALRQALDKEGLQSVKISGTDENQMYAAASGLKYLNKAKGTDASNTPVSKLLYHFNVHAYLPTENGLASWRDNAARVTLRQLAGDRPIWMSEYGDSDGAGMEMAQTIVEDILHLKAEAWVYWQPLEPFSTWGFANGKYAEPSKDADYGMPTWVYYKHAVMAQFSRFIKPGAELMPTGHPHSLAAYDRQRRELVLVVLNRQVPRSLSLDLSALPPGTYKGTITKTKGNGPNEEIFKTTDVGLTDRHLNLEAEAETIYSLRIPNVVL